MSFYPLFFFFFFSLSLSLSHLFISPSPLYLPLSSPPPPPRLSISLNFSSLMGFSTLCLFISLTSWMGFSFISSPPQLIAPSISYLNSTLPTAPIIGDTMLEIFFLPPILLWWFVYERCNFFFPLLLFDSICGFCGMCYY
jgi:hypothetical protein